MRLDATKSNSREGGPSFSLGNRLFRILWETTWFVLARWTPAPLHRWRRLVLLSFGAKIAPSARIYGSARIWYPPNLKVSDYAVIGPHVNCYAQDYIEIGPYAVISQGVFLCAGSHDIEDVNFQLITRPIFIGGEAWVAAEAFVGPGVTVGEGAILGARGVTFRDLRSWTVNVGNPAKELRERTRFKRKNLNEG